jgi:hypothetical protein
MNERIKELARQARAWAETAYKQQNDQFTSHWDTPIGYTPSQFFEQKFAELIVRECLSIVEPTEDSNDEWCVTLKGTAQEIKEHFGVEE